MTGSDYVLQTVALVAQTDPGVNIDIGTTNGLLGGAVGAFLSTLIVGAILVAVVPEYTERMMAGVLDDPIGSFAYGIVSLLAIGLLILLLAITVIGLILAIPLFFVAWLVWAVGAAIASLAIADRLVDRDDGFGAAGFGIVLQGYLG